MVALATTMRLAMRAGAAAGVECVTSTEATDHCAAACSWCPGPRQGMPDVQPSTVKWQPLVGPGMRTQSFRHSRQANTGWAMTTRASKTNKRRAMRMRFSFTALRNDRYTLLSLDLLPAIKGLQNFAQFAGAARRRLHRVHQGRPHAAVLERVQAGDRRAAGRRHHVLQPARMLIRFE